MKVIQIDINILHEDPNNRKIGGVDIIKSVETLGVLQPILVVEEGDGYKIVAGARRVASAKHFGISKIPAIVIESSSVQIQAAENLDRKGLNPIDEANMILAMKKEGMNRETIAGWMNISVQQVARREKLNKLSPKIRSMVKEGKLSASVASEFAMISKEAQERYLEGYHGKNICNISAEVARYDARSFGAKNLNNVVPDLLMMVDFRNNSCKTCEKCSGSDDHTLFEETEEKYCYDGECFLRRLCEFVKRYKVPFLSKDPSINEASETTLDESWEENYSWNSDQYEEVVEGINHNGHKVIYGRGKKQSRSSSTTTKDETKQARKLFNKRISGMNELFASIEKLTGQAIESCYAQDYEIDLMAEKVLSQVYDADLFSYDGISNLVVRGLRDNKDLDEKTQKAKTYARAMLLSALGSPVRWTKQGTCYWPQPGIRDNTLIELAKRYVKDWESSELRLKYIKFWEDCLIEQHKNGNKHAESLLAEAGVSEEAWQ
ncbi:MAG: ParB/RepB/Spo0J family partition protein [Sphaerochaetaceae bacterium]